VIISEINKNFEYYISKNIIFNLVYDTYHPEIEKYGVNTIELCEYFFYQDSEFVISTIYHSHVEKTNEDRWPIAIKGADELLSDFGFSLEEKANFCHSRQLSLFREFNGNKSLSNQLNHKYRSDFLTIQNILTDSGEVFPFELKMLFERKSISNRMILNKISDILHNGKTQQVNKEELLINFIHLFINRIFIANQRLHELVIYYYLMKFYKSEWARKNTDPLNYTNNSSELKAISNHFAF
jgi:lantibiotic biosynthesis protein